MRIRRQIPLLLAVLRLVIGIALPVLAVFHTEPWLSASLFLAGFLSDIFDGILARRMGISTIRLRRIDSRADIVLFVGAGCAVVLRGSATLSEWAPWLAAYGALFFVRNVVDYLRFRTSPSYHMWSGKIWALLVSVYLFFALLGCPENRLLPLAFAVYALNAVEGIVASLVLPHPVSDIPSLWHVFRLRRRLKTP